MSCVISVDGSDLVVEVQGFHKVLAFKGHLRLPLSHVKDIVHDPNVEMTGFRLIGAGVGSWLRAGTYNDNEGLTFWDVHDHSKVVVIGLHDEIYHRLVIEVADPEQAVAVVKAALHA